LGHLRQRDPLLSRGGRSRVPSVVLVGLPNAGKSTLFNALIEENRAIVSDQAGTTRDAITCRINWQQQLVELVDTAGLEELSENSPRALAQGVLQSRMESADLMVLCLDLQKPPRKHWIEQQLTRMRQYAPTIAIGTKADVKTAAFDFPCNVELDCNSKGSLKLLRKEILRQLEDSQRTRKTDVLHHTMLRCREAIGRAQVNLGQAIEGAQSEVGEELVAADLRAAIQELSFVIGEVHTEDILGEIFSRFCIGK
ncbi:MAG: GTPase, partial [Planctomycetota bacterium]